MIEKLKDYYNDKKPNGFLNHIIIIPIKPWLTFSTNKSKVDRFSDRHLCACVQSLFSMLELSPTYLTRV